MSGGGEEELTIGELPYSTCGIPSLDIRYPDDFFRRDGDGWVGSGECLRHPRSIQARAVNDLVEGTEALSDSVPRDPTIVDHEGAHEPYGVILYFGYQHDVHRRYLGAITFNADCE